MHADVCTLKTPLDTLSWLCLLESELLSIRAFQRLDLHTDRDEPNELTFLEDSIIGPAQPMAGLSFYSGKAIFHLCLRRLKFSSRWTSWEKKLTVLLGEGRG
jgi:hypothetical protein